MTEQANPSPKKKVAKVPDVSVTAIGATALFLGALGGLGTQMALGHDPALGAKKPAAQVAVAPVRRKVIVRHIKRRVIVTRVVTDAAPATPVASSGNSYSAPSYQAPAASYSAPSYSAPVVRSSAPVYSAPAPAPVQTATS